MRVEILENMQDDLIHDRSAPAGGDLGFRQRIRVGPMSGRSDVVHRLEEHGIDATDSCVDRIFLAAKQSSRLLEDEEIATLAHEGRATLP